MTPGRSAALLAAVTVALLSAMLPFRPPLGTVWGDEGTFLAMAESVARDRDLRFDDRDRARLEALAPEDRGAGTVILQTSDDGRFSYSKPILYPLLAAPFMPLAGRAGPIVLNILALGLASALAFAALRRRSDRGTAALVLVTFLGASVVLPYVFWRMSDILQLSLVLAGLALSLRASGDGQTETTADGGWIDRLLLWSGAPHFGIVLLAAAATMRINNVALLAVPAMAALLARDVKRTAVLTLVAALATAGWLAFGGALTGELTPYYAKRASFTPLTGYPSATNNVAEEAFTDRPATHKTPVVPAAGVVRSAYATGYFLLGRHSGLLVYFPAALILIIATLRRPDAAGTAALIGFAGSAAFFLIWMPWNYFGGNTFLGNRYLLAAYPALLLAPRRLPSPRMLAVAWLVALVAYGSALMSVVRVHDLDTSSQSHARAGIFRALPYESTSRDLSGNDHYWGEQFVRFVDPFAEIGQWHFVLDSARAPTELLIAQWQPLGTLRLLVEADAPNTALTYRDWRSSTTFALDALPQQDGGAIVDLAVAPPWRRHRFWWHWTQEYNAWLFRLGLRSVDGEPVRANVRLLGDPAVLEASFAHARESLELPQQPLAGSEGTIRLAVRNTSPRPWRPDAVTPVFAELTLVPTFGVPGAIDPGTSTPTAEEVPGAITHAPIRLPSVVESGALTALEIPITWPDTPGSWILEIDLVLTHVGSFASRLGAPLVHENVEIAPR